MNIKSVFYFFNTNFYASYAEVFSTKTFRFKDSPWTIDKKINLVAITMAIKYMANGIFR